MKSVFVLVVLALCLVSSNVMAYTIQVTTSEDFQQAIDELASADQVINDIQFALSESLFVMWHMKPTADSITIFCQEGVDDLFLDEFVAAWQRNIEGNAIDLVIPQLTTEDLVSWDSEKYMSQWRAMPTFTTSTPFSGEDIVALHADLCDRGMPSVVTIYVRGSRRP